MIPRNTFFSFSFSQKPGLSGESNFRVLARKSFNLNVKQKYYLPVYMRISNHDLKFIIPALEHLQRGEIEDGAWIDGLFSYNIIPKSSNKLLLLEFKW